ncbi:MAG: response regulator [Methanomicrobiaceae archaeon]|nr:response regulator [Methanomicrobiaceae archaeon]
MTVDIIKGFKEGFHILIAEDSATQREILKDILKNHNYFVTTAENGKAAFEELTQNRADLIISDIDMPVMDGYEFCSAIKHDERFCDIPVILLTSLSDTRNVALALQAGADNFITKPYDSKYLLSRIEQMIASKRPAHVREESSGPLEILHENQIVRIDADRYKISEFLLSAYDVAVMKQRDLMSAQRELKKANEHLKSLNKDLIASKNETERKHAALIGYMTEYTVRLKQPVEVVLNNLKALAEDLKTNPTVDDETISSALIQIKLMEQIFENLHSLNEAVAEERDDIPDVYKIFLKK